ncbi:hypothetical protein SKAU_G00061200 [Synaphobranchus kaupii]|uniref:Uncharacterized protein n=1 Tax=Synaphobranchus kaupii TaxID=118154 RepID=A0A9Q1JAR6_SYNKA|nr:hypothetical protein SKAU_G00061200 [Synaphobranchus kaupii]
MAEQLRALTELVQQLQADNQKVRQEVNQRSAPIDVNEPSQAHPFMSMITSGITIPSQALARTLTPGTRVAHASAVDAVPIRRRGTLVYRRNHPQGRHQIQGAWHPTVFEVLECLDDGGRVYRIKPQSAEGPHNNIHRSELKPIPAGPGPLILPNIEAHLPSDTSLEEEEEPSEEESGVIAQWAQTSADSQTQHRNTKSSEGATWPHG